MIYGGQVLIVIFLKFVCILSMKLSPSIQSRTARAWSPMVCYKKNILDKVFIKKETNSFLLAHVSFLRQGGTSWGSLKGSMLLGNVSACHKNRAHVRITTSRGASRSTCESRGTRHETHYKRDACPFAFPWTYDWRKSCKPFHSILPTIEAE